MSSSLVLGTKKEIVNRGNLFFRFGGDFKDLKVLNVLNDFKVFKDINPACLRAGSFTEPDGEGTPVSEDVLCGC